MMREEGKWEGGGEGARGQNGNEGGRRQLDGCRAVGTFDSSFN